LGANYIITSEKILQLLWLEDPSNLNHMIRMVKYNQHKEQQHLLILNFDKVDLNQTSDNLVYAPKNKRKVKYTTIPVEFSCRKKLF
jgi:hypothetical protein